MVKEEKTSRMQKSAPHPDRSADFPLFLVSLSRFCYTDLVFIILTAQAWQKGFFHVSYHAWILLSQNRNGFGASDYWYRAFWKEPIYNIIPGDEKIGKPFEVTLEDQTVLTLKKRADGRIQIYTSDTPGTSVILSPEILKRRLLGR